MRGATSSKIAFISTRNLGRPKQDNELYVVNADGSGKRALSRTAHFASPPAWSPDGRKIVFRSVRHRNQDIYVMNADGTGERRLTRHPADDRDPAWSPDGRKIAFVSDRDRSRDGVSEIYVVNADGSGERRLTHNVRPDSSPAWSPDGRKIAFASRRRDLCHERRRQRTAPADANAGKDKLTGSQALFGRLTGGRSPSPACAAACTTRSTS